MSTPTPAPSDDDTLGTRRAAGLEFTMIMICERCFTPIGEGESMVRLAHIDQAHADGSVTWVYAYVHVTACVTPRVADHERPDTGAWDASRGIGGFRA